MVPCEPVWAERSITYRLMTVLSEDGPSGQNIRTILEYSEAHPHQVRLALIPEDRIGNIQIYEFARELLWDGLAAPAGEGNVQVRPHDTTESLITLRLTAPGAYPFEIDADRATVTDFAELVYMLVTDGCEDTDDLDAELAALTGGES